LRKHQGSTLALQSAFTVRDVYQFDGRHVDFDILRELVGCPFCIICLHVGGPLFEIQLGIKVSNGIQLIWLVCSTVVGCDHHNYAGKVHSRGLVLMHKLKLKEQSRMHILPWDSEAYDD
jgi:hypothetical protein